MSDFRYITDRRIYEEVILRAVPGAQKFLWIATADLKDLYVEKGKRMVPFLRILSELADSGVAIRLIHSKEPGPAFRRDFDSYPGLIEGMERLLCPRVHFKCVIIDGKFAYTGSANLTGAGIGAKSINKRNFENGFIIENKEMIKEIMEQFDNLWIGKHCDKCGRVDYCAEKGGLR